jgi:hypothetical protein
MKKPYFGHLCCLAIINNFAKNIPGRYLHEYIFLFLLGRYPRMELMGHMGNLMSLCSNSQARKSS